MTILEAANCHDIGFDYNQVLNRFCNNEALMNKFIKKFLQDENYSQLIEAVKAGDYPMVERTAHTLKGVSANLGFDHLFQHCNQMVVDVREKGYEKLEADLKEIVAAYEQVTAFIQALD